MNHKGFRFLCVCPPLCIFGMMWRDFVILGPFPPSAPVLLCIITIYIFLHLECFRHFWGHLELSAGILSCSDSTPPPRRGSATPDQNGPARDDLPDILGGVSANWFWAILAGVAKITDQHFSFLETSQSLFQKLLPPPPLPRNQQTFVFICTL